jgi:hypothetical protein
MHTNLLLVCLAFSLSSSFSLKAQTVEPDTADYVRLLRGGIFIGKFLNQHGDSILMQTVDMGRGSERFTFLVPEIREIIFNKPLISKNPMAFRPDMPIDDWSINLREGSGKYEKVSIDSLSSDMLYVSIGSDTESMMKRGISLSEIQTLRRNTRREAGFYNWIATSIGAVAGGIVGIVAVLRGDAQDKSFYAPAASGVILGGVLSGIMAASFTHNPDEYNFTTLNLPQKRGVVYKIFTTNKPQ